MLLGSVDRDWAAHHHGAWLAGLEGEARAPGERGAEAPSAVRVPLTATQATAADGGR
jgi:hypothetical protein